MTKNQYINNARLFGWGIDKATLNPEKTKLLDSYAKGKVIDIGTGSGIYANYLTKNSHKVTAIDNQKTFIQKAKNKYPKVKFQQASAYNLPFAPNSFDTAILFDILEHLDDEKALDEASRIATRLIISTPRVNQPSLTKWSLAHHHYLDTTHKRTYTQTSLKKLFQKCKLKPIYLQEALPISVYGLTIEHLSKGNKLKKLLLKLLLKPFTPEKPLYSTIFAIAERSLS